MDVPAVTLAVVAVGRMAVVESVGVAGGDTRIFGTTDGAWATGAGSSVSPGRGTRVGDEGTGAEAVTGGVSIAFAVAVLAVPFVVVGEITGVTSDGGDASVDATGTMAGAAGVAVVVGSGPVESSMTMSSMLW